MRQSHHRQAEERVCAQGRRYFLAPSVLADLGQEPVQPGAALAVGAARSPEEHQGAGQAQPDDVLPFLGRPAQRRAQIILLGGELPLPGDLVRTGERRPQLLGEGQVVAGVSYPQGGEFAARHQSFAGVFADQFEHAEARLTIAGLLALHQALIVERGQAVEHGRVVVSRDRLNRCQRDATLEDGQAGQQPLLLLGQQRVAPVERGAQRLLACRQIARAAGEEGQATVQARQERRQGEELGARRGELDRQRQAVEAAADGGEGRHVGICRGEARVGGLRPFEEEGGSGELRQVGEGSRLLRLRQGQGRDEEFVLAPDLQRHPAGHQELHSRAGGEKLGQGGHGRDDLLQVVEDEQDLAVAQQGDQRVGLGLAGGRPWLPAPWRWWAGRDPGR